MPLNLVVDTLDSVPEALRNEYAEKDGKFHLNVSGLEDTAGLKSALKKERDAVAKHKADMKALADKVSAWEGLGKSEDEIKELLDKASKADQDALEKSGNHKAIIDGLHERYKGDIAKLQDGWTKKESDYQKKLETAFASERKAIVETGVNSALVKAKATAEGIDLLTERLSRRVVVETDDDGNRVYKIMQADGKTPMAGKGENGAATWDDLVLSAVDTWPSLFEGSGAGGGGKSGRDGAAGSGKKVMSRAEFDALPHMERSQRIRDKWQIRD